MSYTTVNELMTATADAIREKLKTEDKISSQDFPTKILEITGGGSAEKAQIVNGNYLFYYNFYKELFDDCDFSKMKYMDSIGYQSDFSSLSESEMNIFLNSELIENADSAFAHCQMPPVLGDVYLPNCISGTTLFYFDWTITQIGDIYVPKLPSVSNFMSGCKNIKKIGNINVSSATKLDNLLKDCTSLEEVGQITFNTENAITRIGGLFSNCTKLKQLLNLNLSKFDVYFNTYDWIFPSGSAKTPAALERLTFANFEYSNTSAKNIYIPYCSLNHDAIVEMFNTMPDAPTASKITITGNPGVSTLTDDEISIATNKNYSLIY